MLEVYTDGRQERWKEIKIERKKNEKKRKMEGKKLRKEKKIKEGKKG